MTGEDCFTCLFDSMEARDTILMGGPWYVGGFIIGLDRWTPEFNPDSMAGLSAPIWIRFPLLPLLYWDNENLARIAAKIGMPLWIDAQTSAWGSSSYARVCIRLDLARQLPKGVWINGIKGRFFQKVEYEGISALCFQCGLVGHRVSQCPNARSQQDSMASAELAKGNNANKDGNKDDDAANKGEKGSDAKRSGHDSSRTTYAGPVHMEAEHSHGSHTNKHANISAEDGGGWTLVTRRKLRNPGVRPPNQPSQKQNPEDSQNKGKEPLISVHPDAKTTQWDGREGRRNLGAEFEQVEASPSFTFTAEKSSSRRPPKTKLLKHIA